MNYINVNHLVRLYDGMWWQIVDTLHLYLSDILPAMEQSKRQCLRLRYMQLKNGKVHYHVLTLVGRLVNLMMFRIGCIRSILKGAHVNW